MKKFRISFSDRQSFEATLEEISQAKGFNAQYHQIIDALAINESFELSGNLEGKVIQVTILRIV